MILPRRKVLVVTSLFPTASDPGRAIFNWHQTRALAKLCDIAVVAPLPWAPPVLPRRDFRRFRAAPARESREGIEIHRPRYLVVPGRLRGVQGWSYTRQLRGACARLRAEGFHPDAIFATWIYPDVYAATIVGAELGVPVVGRVIGSDLHILPAQGAGDMIRATLRKADRVVAVCDDLRRRALDLGAPEARTVVIENGIDTEHFRPRDRSEARRGLGLDASAEIILFIGNLVRVKAPDVLLEAFATLHRNRGAAQLIYLGDGELLGGLQEKAASLGISGSVRFAGRRPHDEVARWLNAADVLALPSRSEGQPNVVLEAIASGTPVVASRLPGVAEVLVEGKAGYLTPIEAPDAFASALERVLDGHFDLATVRGSLRAISWDESARRIWREIEDLLGIPPSPRDSRG